MKKIKKKISVYFFVILFVSMALVPRKGAEATALPDNNLCYPVQVILEDGSNATGFYVRGLDEKLFFVTAKHILFNQRTSGQGLILKSRKAVLLAQAFPLELDESIIVSLDLQSLWDRENMKIHPTKDVVVMKIADVVTKGGKKGLKYAKGVFQKEGETKGEIIVIDLKEVKKYNEVSLSNDVFIFGYPTSLGIKQIPQIDYTKPLLRKGIIAGKNNKNKTIILDCPAYYGNSGGPCIEVEDVGLAKKRFLPIGIVTQFIPFEEEWLNVKHGYTNVDFENSGYSVVEPMDTVIELVGQIK